MPLPRSAWRISWLRDPVRARSLLRRRGLRRPCCSGYCGSWPVSGCLPRRRRACSVLRPRRSCCATCLGPCAGRRCCGVNSAPSPGVTWSARCARARRAISSLRACATGSTTKRTPAGAVFNAGMTSGTRARAEQLVATYDFPTTGTVVDVAGGHGALLAAILQARPGMRGVLFDAPHVVGGAQPLLEAAGVADRCTVVGGDFFESVPRGGDVYTLKLIIHDWDDERATTILRNCWRAMDGHGTLLVMEGVMPSGIATKATEYFDAARADVTMMMWTGGKHRTVDEFRDLFGAAGFTLGRVIPTGSRYSVVEAHP